MTLGLLRLCADQQAATGTHQAAPADQVALRWEESELGPVPVLRCGWDRQQLLDNVYTRLCGAAAWVTEDEWGKLSLPGKQAVDFINQAPLASAFDVKHHLRGLFCRSQKGGEVGLTPLLGGITAQVRLSKVVPKLAESVRKHQDDVEATLFGPWQPKVIREAASLGLDWATVSDGTRAGGTSACLPARDLLALLGATWTPRLPTSDMLVWATWSEWMEPADVSVLATRPELWRLARSITGRTDLKRRDRVALAKTLHLWSVTRVCVSQSIVRTMHKQSRYQLWQEAEIVDLRALR